MHDSQGKKRDLRKAFLGGDRPSLFEMFDKEHPESNNYDNWYIYRNEKQAWITEKLGYRDSWHHGGNAPADFRRDLNREHRAKEKAALRRAFLRDEWDDFQLPRYKHNANWLWW